MRVKSQQLWHGTINDMRTNIGFPDLLIEDGVMCSDLLMNC
jgi:hypothetical protein